SPKGLRPGEEHGCKPLSQGPPARGRTRLRLNGFAVERDGCYLGRDRRDPGRDGCYLGRWAGVRYNMGWPTRDDTSRANSSRRAICPAPPSSRVLPKRSASWRITEPLSSPATFASSSDVSNRYTSTLSTRTWPLGVRVRRRRQPTSVTADSATT